MPRKFLSFLGTTKYIPANYFFMDEKAENVSFVQEALVKIFCKDWENTDKIIIFCTEEAEDKNWKDKEESQKANFEKGLRSRLISIGLKAQLEKINIPKGDSEDEIAEIFKLILNSIDEGDKIILDITHSFRSIPMLSLAVLTYAKFIKNIEISGIYYGAFEALGNHKKVEEKPIYERNVPIFDLTPYAKLIEWSFAVSDFVRFGQAQRISELMGEELNPILRETKGRDRTASKLRSLAKGLENLSKNIAYVRGREIIKQGNFNDTIEFIKGKTIIPFFEPLLEEVRQKTEKFEENSLKNGIVAAKWCYKHNLVQQGITILQETIISILCKKHGLSLLDEKDRTFISSCLNIKNKPKNEWKGEVKERLEEAERIINSIPHELADFFKELTSLRNDVNHAGLRKDPRSWKTIKDEFRKLIGKVESIIVSLGDAFTS